MSERICVLLAIVSAVAAALPIHASESIEAIEQALSDGNYETAYENAVRVLKKEPDNARALYVAGAAGVMLEGQDESVDKGNPERCLERALELSPDTLGAHYLLGYSSFHRGQRLRSRDKTEKALEAFSAAAGRFEAELRLHAGYVKALEGLALALAELPEEPERSIRAHEAWLAADPAALSAYPSLAKSMIAVGRFDDAIALLDRLPNASQEASWTATFQILAAVAQGEDRGPHRRRFDPWRSVAPRVGTCTRCECSSSWRPTRGEQPPKSWSCSSTLIRLISSSRLWSTSTSNAIHRSTWPKRCARPERHRHFPRAPAPRS